MTRPVKLSIGGVIRKSGVPDRVFGKIQFCARVPKNIHDADHAEDTQNCDNVKTTHEGWIDRLRQSFSAQLRLKSGSFAAEREASLFGTVRFTRRAAKGDQVADVNFASAAGFFAPCNTALLKQEHDNGDHDDPSKHQNGTHLFAHDSLLSTLIDTYLAYRLGNTKPAKHGRRMGAVSALQRLNGLGIPAYIETTRAFCFDEPLKKRELNIVRLYKPFNDAQRRHQRQRAAYHGFRACRTACRHVALWR